VNYVVLRSNTATTTAS